MTTKILSLGAGVQSSALFIASSRGELNIPRYDHAIFADVGWEPPEVMEWLETILMTESRKSGIPIHVVSYGNIKTDTLEGWKKNKKVDGRNFAALPFFAMTPEGKGEIAQFGTKVADKETEGKLPRQCTSRYKAGPVEDKMRELMGVKTFGACAPRSIEHHFGMSRDEMQRMRISTRKAITYHYPLIIDGPSDTGWKYREKPLTRMDCIDYIRNLGLGDPPRSACIGCPFHSNAKWRYMRDQRPELWAEAVQFDKDIRQSEGLRKETFLHRSCVPLDQAPIDDNANQGLLFEPDGCDTGYCGI